MARSRKKTGVSVSNLAMNMHITGLSNELPARSTSHVKVECIIFVTLEWITLPSFYLL